MTLFQREAFTLMVALVLGASPLTALQEAPKQGAADENSADENAAAENTGVWTLSAADDRYAIEVDTSDTPDLSAWAREKLSPVLVEWYPRIVAMLPSEGFEAPRELSVTFRNDYRGVASASGTRVRCAAEWFRRNLDGEARGAVVHELVHVVQQYGRGRRGDGGRRARPPGWLVEGIADQIRWFLYEPESRGAEISRRRLERARYDGNYRVSANFLDWATHTHDEALVRKLNAAIRDGAYSEALWGELCDGRTLEELDAQWKEALEAKLAAAEAAEVASAASAAPADVSEGADQETANADTGAATGGGAAAAEETAPAGDRARRAWRSLFDGRTLDGWHTFRREGARPGWQVKDGTLACVDPHDAGDLCTDERFDWFELELEYRIAEAGNSGIMYHVTDEERTAWRTGPEFQLEDNARAGDPWRCGWLYGLYKSPEDPETGKRLDATKPAGEWNHVRLLVSPERCEHAINGVKYFEYVLDSDDFRERVARSKFRDFPRFAEKRSGYIALQGDHGEIAFRNIRIRSIEPAAPARVEQQDGE